MELEEIKSDLHALRQLYGLLQTLISRQSVSKPLDERALQLLKRLLDNASQKISSTEIKAEYYQPKVSNLQASTTNSNQIVPSKKLLSHNNIHSSDQQMIIVNFDSSPTGFSTPSLGFDDEIYDTNSDPELEHEHHGTFLKEVSKAIGLLDSHILSLHMQTSGSGVSNTKYVKPKLEKAEMDSTTRPSNCHVPGLKVTFPIDQKSLVDRRVIVRNRKPRVKMIRAHHGGRIERLPEPESYSTDQSESVYSSNNEEKETLPIEDPESSDFDDYDDDDDDDDDDEMKSSDCSSCSISSISSYSTAKRETPNYPRRRMEDCLERSVTRGSTLRRIKNKLGLIFHHHHHHHYHQHHRQDQNPNTSKPLQRMFRNDDKRDQGISYDHGRDYDDNNNNIYAKRSSGDVGHFRSLVEVLTRHVDGGGRKNNRGSGVKINGNYRRRRVKVGFQKTKKQTHKF